jgi:hypothetical protein
MVSSLVVSEPGDGRTATVADRIDAETRTG